MKFKGWLEARNPYDPTISRTINPIDLTKAPPIQDVRATAGVPKIKQREFNWENWKKMMAQTQSLGEKKSIAAQLLRKKEETEGLTPKEEKLLKKFDLSNFIDPKSLSSGPTNATNQPTRDDRGRIIVTPEQRRKTDAEMKASRNRTLPTGKPTGGIDPSVNLHFPDTNIVSRG